MTEQQRKEKRTAIKKLRRQEIVLKILLLGMSVAILIFLILCLQHLFSSSKRKAQYAKTYQKYITEQSSSSAKNSAQKTDNFSSDIPLSSDPFLRLVNEDHPVPADYQVTLTQLRNNQQIASSCYPDLQKMMDDCRAAGLHPVICSSYRTAEKQNELFQEKVRRLVSQGYTASDAEKKAKTEIAPPNTSEHQLGLALDIVDESYQHLETDQQDTMVQRWLIAHSWEYGFVLRYPLYKSDITGIIYEPWHYRYVGKEAAEYMHTHNLCLEEYLQTLK